MHMPHLGLNRTRRLLCKNCVINYAKLGAPHILHQLCPTHARKLLKILYANDCEYTEERMVRYNGAGPTFIYVVCWNVYNPGEDTMKTPEHVLAHFIYRFLAARPENGIIQQK